MREGKDMDDLNARVLTPLCITPASDSEYELAKPFDFEVFWKGTRWLFIVKRGFRTDGASIPRCLWRIAGNPWTPRARAYAAFLHDCLYRTNFFPREVCDALYGLVERDFGYPGWKSWIELKCLRAFGGFAYKDAKKDKSKWIDCCSKLYVEKDGERYWFC